MTDKLAIIVPYRDREEHLNVFVPHMMEFLKDKGIDYTIFIIEQSDDRPFNYGKLCNSAVKEIGEEYTYFAFHDIDMLPIDDECDYGYPDVPLHLATNVEAHDYKLPYPQYFGGVILISREDFETANGYSNEYWGYGFEDLDLLYRLERSGGYLEKFYDTNRTYSEYDELDVLPYRIENVKISNNSFSNEFYFSKFEEADYIHGNLNPLTKNITKNSFSFSFWFKDSSERKPQKNLLCFEGYDTGLFLNNGNQIIAQIWNEEETHEEVSLSYSRNKWNYVSFEYDIKSNEIILTLNKKKQVKKLEDNFKVYDYDKKAIKISDDKSEIELSEIFIFDSLLNDDIKNKLYSYGTEALSDIKTQYGISPALHFDYKNTYSRDVILDKGNFRNHLKIYGKLQPSVNKVELTDVIYLPSRLDGKYKSLAHTDDSDIIEKYYKYNPDILENSDIFFHDVLPNQLDYKSIGLSTIKYTLLDKQQRNNYELIRIVT